MHPLCPFPGNALSVPASHKMPADTSALEARVKQLEAQVKDQELMEGLLRGQVKELEVARAGDQEEKKELQRKCSLSAVKAAAPADEATVLLGTLQGQLKSEEEREETLEDKIRRLHNEVIEAKEAAVEVEMENEELKQRIKELEEGPGPKVVNCAVRASYIQWCALGCALYGTCGVVGFRTALCFAAFMRIFFENILEDCVGHCGVH